MDFIIRFARRLKMCRDFCNLTQSQLAGALHMKLRSYQKYESGERSPKLETLCDIATILGVSTDFLLMRDSDIIDNSDIRIKELKILLIETMSDLKFGYDTVDNIAIRQEEITEQMQELRERETKRFAKNANETKQPPTQPE